MGQEHRTYVANGPDRFGNTLEQGSHVQLSTGQLATVRYLYTAPGSTELLQDRLSSSGAREILAALDNDQQVPAASVWVQGSFSPAAAEQGSGASVAWRPLFEVPDGYEIIVPRSLGGDDVTWRTIVGSRYSEEFTEYFVEGVSAGLVVDNARQHDLHVFSRASDSGAEIVDAIRMTQIVAGGMPQETTIEKATTVESYSPLWPWAVGDPAIVRNGSGQEWVGTVTGLSRLREPTIVDRWGNTVELTASRRSSGWQALPEWQVGDTGFMEHGDSEWQVMLSSMGPGQSPVFVSEATGAVFSFDQHHRDLGFSVTRDTRRKPQAWNPGSPDAPEDPGSSEPPLPVAKVVGHYAKPGALGGVPLPPRVPKNPFRGPVQPSEPERRRLPGMPALDENDDAKAEPQDTIVFENADRCFPNNFPSPVFMKDAPELEPQTHWLNVFEAFTGRHVKFGEPRTANAALEMEVMMTEQAEGTTTFVPVLDKSAGECVGLIVGDLAFEERSTFKHWHGSQFYCDRRSVDWGYLAQRNRRSPEAKEGRSAANTGPVQLANADQLLLCYFKVNTRIFTGPEGVSDAIRHVIDDTGSIRRNSILPRSPWNPVTQTIQNDSMALTDWSKAMQLVTMGYTAWNKDGTSLFTQTEAQTAVCAQKIRGAIRRRLDYYPYGDRMRTVPEGPYHVWVEQNSAGSRLRDFDLPLYVGHKNNWVAANLPTNTTLDGLRSAIGKSTAARTRLLTGDASKRQEIEHSNVCIALYLLRIPDIAEDYTVGPEVATLMQPLSRLYDHDLGPSGTFATLGLEGNNRLHRTVGSLIGLTWINTAAQSLTKIMPWTETITREEHWCALAYRNQTIYDDMLKAIGKNTHKAAIARSGRIHLTLQYEFLGPDAKLGAFAVQSQNREINHEAQLSQSYATESGVEMRHACAATLQSLLDALGPEAAQDALSMLAPGDDEVYPVAVWIQVFETAFVPEGGGEPSKGLVAVIDKHYARLAKSGAYQGRSKDEVVLLLHDRVLPYYRERIDDGQKDRLSQRCAAIVATYRIKDLCREAQFTLAEASKWGLPNIFRHCIRQFNLGNVKRMGSLIALLKFVPPLAAAYRYRHGVPDVAHALEGRVASTVSAEERAALPAQFALPNLRDIVEAVSRGHSSGDDSGIGGVGAIAALTLMIALARRTSAT